jgi:hypothetical protein
VVDALLRRQARRHLVDLDHQDTGRCQARILRGLVHRAQSTPFGRDHDFRRIRSPDDFRRLVPLCRSDDTQRNGQLTEAGMPPAVASGHYQAAIAALAFVGASRPPARPLLGGLQFMPTTQRASQAALARMPLLRRFLHDRRPTVAVGPVHELVQWFAENQRGIGADGVVAPRSELAVVIYSRRPNDPDRADLINALGMSPGPLLLEACWRAEGAIAVEDPRHNLLRLLTDHGVYFEFVPVEEVDQPEPVRHTADKIEPGVAYRVAMTSAAGVWASLTDITVRFERRDPPLLQRLEVQPAAPVGGEHAHRDQRLIPSPPHPFMAQPPHPRNGDSLARRPGSFGRSPWSARADRE